MGNQIFGRLVDFEKKKGKGDEKKEAKEQNPKQCLAD